MKKKKKYRCIIAVTHFKDFLIEAANKREAKKWAEEKAEELNPSTMMNPFSAEATVRHVSKFKVDIK